VVMMAIYFKAVSKTPSSKLSLGKNLTKLPGIDHYFDQIEIDKSRTVYFSRFL
jgi:hypothetical protein